MSVLTNTPVLLENSNFSILDENSTTLPILVPNLNPESEINSNISAPIFSDSDISLPNITNLKEFPTSDSNSNPFGNSDGPLNPKVSETDFLNYDFDAFNFEASDSNSDTKPTTTTTSGPFDFMNYDFGAVDFGEEKTEDETAAAAPNLEDFATYDFDSFSFDTSGNEAANDSEFDMGSFADYNFDLFGEDDKAKSEPEEYDFNDGWLDPNFKYVEKTAEEKRIEDEEFEEEWKSIVLPPAVRYKPPFIIDLNPWLLWGPPILCLFLLCLVFVPCVFLMRNDDKREKMGKKRKYGPQRLMVQVQKELHIRTSSGEWKVLPSCNENECCVNGKTPALDPSKITSNVISEIPPFKGQVSVTNQSSTPSTDHKDKTGSSAKVVTVVADHGEGSGAPSGSSDPPKMNTSSVEKDKNWSMYKNT